MPLPGRRDERTEPLKTNCPLAARRENAPAVAAPQAVLKSFETTFQIGVWRQPSSVLGNSVSNCGETGLCDRLSNFYQRTNKYG